MKKTIIIGVSVLLAIVIGVIAWAVLIGNKRSPAKTASISNAGLDVSVSYCAPYKKGRVIFGDEKDGALQPFGKYWRVGANGATEISFSKDVTFGGKAIKAGKYSMYAIPGPDTWQVCLNSEVDKWGASEPDYDKDVLKATIPSSSNPLTEQFVINFANDSTAVNMDLVWDNVLVRVPIRPQ